MKFIETNLKGVVVIKPDVHRDKRGFFLESFNLKKINEQNINYTFVQDNHSRSTKNVLRGLHFQKKNPQGKLVRCTRGSVYDVAVDINPNSPTFCQHFGIELNDINNEMLWIPPGYAHGFCVTSDVADFNYKCTNFYYADDQCGIIWSDKDLNIDWPVKTPIISKKDALLPNITELY